jgi:predicted permease
MTESVLLALIGGAAGVGLALVGLKVLLALAPQDIPRVTEVGLNLRVLVVTLGISVAVGLAFGLVPTVQAFHVDIMRTIRGEANGGTGTAAARRFREGLVIAELALSVTLVVCAGLLIRSFWSVLRVDPGFQAQGVVKAEFQLPTARYPENYRIWPAWKEVHAFDQKLLEEVRAIPGVTDAALANVNPLDAGFTNSFQIVGREAESKEFPEISIRMVTPGYFSTLGVKTESGRTFTDGDDATSGNVAMINMAAAKRFFPTQEPIGQQVRFWGAARTIIGVVGDERIHGLTEPVPVALYLPTAQNPRVGVVFARVTGDPSTAVEALRRAVLAADPGLAVYGAEPLSVTLKESQGQRRFAMLVLVSFAAVTFLLALVGIHGVLSYTTSQRTREIGIRMALGATGTGVTGLVMRGGLRLAMIGTALGLVGAALGSRLLTGLLYGVARIDLVTFTAVGIAAIGSALLAIWMPARRAAGVAPISCLRAE